MALGTSASPSPLGCRTSLTMSAQTPNFKRNSKLPAKYGFISGNGNRFSTQASLPALLARAETRLCRRADNEVRRCHPALLAASRALLLLLRQQLRRD